MRVAQRERLASAARAQRELSAPAPAHKAGGVGVLSCARHSDARCRCGARSTALTRVLPARSARRCGASFARYTRGPRYLRAAAAGVPVRVRVRCSLRGASAMRRERRPIAVPTPPCPRVPSHPQPARGRAGPQRGEETTRTTPAGACPRPSTQPQEEARLERPRSPPQSRPASSDQAHRASSVGSHLEGGRGGAPSLHLHQSVASVVMMMMMMLMIGKWNLQIEMVK